FSCTRFFTVHLVKYGLTHCLKGFFADDIHVIGLGMPEMSERAYYRIIVDDIDHWNPSLFGNKFMVIKNLWLYLVDEITSVTQACGSGPYTVNHGRGIPHREFLPEEFCAFRADHIEEYPIIS